MYSTQKHAQFFFHSCEVLEGNYILYKEDDNASLRAGLTVSEVMEKTSAVAFSLTGSVLMSNKAYVEMLKFKRQVFY